MHTERDANRALHASAATVPTGWQRGVTRRASRVKLRPHWLRRLAARWGLL